MSSDSQTAHHVRDNTFKIVDETGNFHGSCFFIEVNKVNYCVTCHHCIWKLDAIFVQFGSNEKFPLKWLDKYSDPTKDIAVLSIDDKSQINPLIYEPKALPELPIYVMGWPEDRVNDLVTASKEDDSNLSNVSIGIKIREETVCGLNNPWNVKPKGTVNLLGFKGNYNRGLSGSPVCYKANNNVVGIFTAIDDYVHGYALPVQTLLEKFEANKPDAKQSVKYIESQESINTIANLEQANKFLENHEIEKAIEKFDEILYQPNYVNALFKKAYSLGEVKKHDEALKWSNAFLAFRPNDLDALNNKGWNLGKLRRFEDAIKQYDIILAIDPNYFNALFNKALVLDNLGRFREALAFYNRALVVSPNNVNILGNIGLNLDNLGKHNEAIEWYNKALAINPNHVNNIALKALSLSKLGKDDVSNSADLILAINPDDFIALDNIGLALSYLGKYKEAIEWYDKALAIDPNYITSLDNKGSALASFGKYKEAIEWYDKALAIDPNYITSLSNKGVALASFGKYKEAIEWYDRALAVYPKDKVTLTNRGITLGKLGMYKEAIESYDKALAIDPNYFIALKNKKIAKGKIKKLKFRKNKKT